MTPTPPSATTTTSAGAASVGHTSDDQYRIVRRRNRVPLSCYPCRSRKLKCNRGTPSCENCVKRGDTQSCVYATPAIRKGKNHNGAAAASTPDDMQNRIDRLEGLVLSLMHSGASPSTNTSPTAMGPIGTGDEHGSGDAGAGTGGASSSSVADSSCGRPRTSTGGRSNHNGDGDSLMRTGPDGESDVDDGLASSLGILKVDADKGKSMYIGAEAWHNLLADITEVKNFYAKHKQEMMQTYERVMESKPAVAREAPTFLGLSAPSATETELRAELPAKSTIQMLVARFYNSLDATICLIHGPSFQNELREFWQDPTQADIMWVGLLYSMLTLALLSYHKIDDEPPELKGRSLELAAEYRLRTVQCLNVSDYTRPVQYTIETMILYLLGEMSSRWDADHGLWLISSMITRTAFRMGYHRDPEWFPSITPFQGEMRRRAWATIRMTDVMFSSRVSLPTMIYDHVTDTKLPHNLFDEEFGPDTKALPLSRSREEATPISFVIAKTQLYKELGNVLQAVTRIGKHVTYDEVLELDHKLRMVIGELPPHLQLQPLDGCHDPIVLIVSRIGINMTYRKIICILHGKFLARAHQNPKYENSRRSAIEASLEILQIVKVIHHHSKPNGKLHSVRNYLNPMMKESLLPTMLVLLDLHHDNLARTSKDRPDSEAPFFWTPEQRLNMITSLEEIRDVWTTMSDESVEGFKAAGILNTMLAKIKNPLEPGAEAEAAKDGPYSNYNAGDMQPEHSAAITLNMLSSGVGSTFQSPGGTSYPPVDYNGNPMPLDPRTQAGPTVNSGASPFSAFNHLGGIANGGLSLDQAVDWAAFENYTQNAPWTDTGGIFFGRSENMTPQPGRTTADGPYAFPNMPTPSASKS